MKRISNIEYLHDLNFSPTEDILKNYKKKIYTWQELVKVSNTVLHRVQGSKGYDKSKLEFDYNNTHYYNMSVTDSDYFYIEDGTSLGDAVLVISLANNNYMDFGYFKFVAKIFRLN